MTILVTGATGNVASALIPTLLQSGQKVRALVHDEAKASGLTVKGGVKVYQRGGAKLYQWTRQHDWERCRGLLKLGPSRSPDLNSSCCYA